MAPLLERQVARFQNPFDFSGTRFREVFQNLVRRRVDRLNAHRTAPFYPEGQIQLPYFSQAQFFTVVERGQRLLPTKFVSKKANIRSARASSSTTFTFVCTCESRGKDRSPGYPPF